MGDKIISVYWFVILFIVAAAVVYMVYSFYGEPYDVRKIETQKLNNLVVECFLNGVRLDETFRAEDFSDNFLELCNLNLDTEDIYNWRARGQYFVSVNLSEFNSGAEIFSHYEGNSDLADSCSFDGREFPVCFERAVYILDEDNNPYKLYVLSIVRKTEKNVN